MECQNNQTLLELVRSGDSAAFEKLYGRERDRVMGFSYRLLRSQEEAKELTQDVFVQLWENREKIDPSKNIDTLLFVMAKHTFYDAQKKKTHFLKFLEQKGPEEPQTNSTGNYIDMQNCLDVVNGAVETLPPQAKLVYTLSREEGYSHREISERLAISTNTVSNHIKVAISHIRNHFNRFSPDTILSILPILSVSFF
ncbi:RNA polymerase sigma factor [Sphingobacterium hotanense]|uniref:RNA polymerase sigma factor n=1 Tax=Sphingobacterium TaxID=28453 RepID=UPI0021A3CBB2|nr:sigma-70 family RNA polymerase sigma factor [Sphingobacterium hotanense]MCT1523675.1 sigma-70 family RNA polymerase sigma factor [Sphingobacterium hotanense]